MFHPPCVPIMQVCYKVLHDMIRNHMHIITYVLMKQGKCGNETPQFKIEQQTINKGVIFNDLVFYSLSCKRH